MSTTYTIHLKNLQAAEKTFWCFLDCPESKISADVYANSSANLTVVRYQSGKDDCFTIPLQYAIQAGASNQAVALDTLIRSSIKKDTGLAAVWNANYFPANKGPSLIKQVEELSPDSKEIDIITNDFDKDQEPLKHWYSNLTFGVKSQNGFMGVTWSPDPEELYRLKPKVQFYIATGNYESNRLVDITSISYKSALINADSFDGNNECTVTLLANGKWKVEPGNLNDGDKNQRMSDSVRAEIVAAHTQLIAAHNVLITSHQQLIASDEKFVPLLDDNDAHFSGVLAPLNAEESVISGGIIFDDEGSIARNAGDGGLILSGTIAVATAVAAGFLYMIAGGITLTIKKRKKEGLEYEFTYNGEKGAEALSKAFAVGQKITFKK